MTVRMPTQHAAVDAIVDKLAELEQRKACGTFVLDVKDGRVLAAKFQSNERVDLTPKQEGGN